ncbi:hypothetical protein [Sphingomonas sp. BK580]|uniref:hypothetical protein n=1 Tax=Sphingomonas sp. BK580 TaxID=2586972 RepID=UPI00161202E8|nr:hypothetical protein [Sphingomonas sp. BK580]MBB3692480.1 sterol desaturase/sphingolipid hydroxylase (fatty acid hydroxylase superfamily) [Sphingomonas sp. BK580]
MKRMVLAGAASLSLAWFAVSGWIYIERGYSLAFAMEGYPVEIKHFDFPAWRAAVHLLLSAGAIAAVLTSAFSQRWAPSVAWAIWVLTVAVGYYDVDRWGLMASPTSIWTVLIVMLVAIVVSVAKRTRA